MTRLESHVDALQAEVDALQATVEECLPEYQLGDEVGDEANHVERIEYAGDELRDLQREVAALTAERDEMTETLAREQRCNAIADDLFEAYVERLEAELLAEVARLRALVAEACDAASSRPLSHDGENIKRMWAARIGAIREATSARLGE